MEQDFWLARWNQQQIGFHQASATPMLLRHHEALGAPQGSRVLVPLCGKTLDMPWLAAQGREVVGVELSQLAVDAFFAEHELTPQVETLGPFTRHRSGRIEILCGDFFLLQPEHVGRIDALFDRAALVALPRPMRERYASKLAQLVPPGARGLLVSFEYEPESVPGPPFSLRESDVRALHEPAFTVTCLERADILAGEPRYRERGITALHESAYALQRRSA